MGKRIIIILTFIFWISIVSAQWTDHYSLNSSIFVGNSGDKVYAGNAMGLFCYDNSDYSFSKITKTNHLSDINISTTATIDGYIYIGYSNGNIDIFDVDEYSTENLPELKNNINYASKSINKFYSQGNFVYVASTCGIIVIDKSKREIKTQYKVDYDGSITITDICISDGYIYAATSNGLYRANMSSKILEDQKEWEKINNDAIESIVGIGDKVIAAIKDGNNHAIVVANRAPMDTIGVVSSFRTMIVEGEQMAIVADNKITIKDGNLKNVKIISKYNIEGTSKLMSPRNVSYIGKEMLAVADYENGLVITDYNGDAKSITCNGPSNNNCYNIIANGNIVVASGGGITSSYNNKEIKGTIHSLIDGKWSTQTTSNGRDFLMLGCDPKNVDSIYVATWGNGIFKIENGEIGMQYNSLNSPLVDIFGGDKYTRIGCLAYDNESNLYMLNALVALGAIIKTPNNEWHSLSYGSLSSVHSRRAMIFTPNGNCWIISGQTTGIVVFNTNGTIEDEADDMYRGPSKIDNDSRFKGVLQLWDSNGDVIDDISTAIAVDNDGQIWIGTRDGVVTFNDDKNIFDISKPVFNRIKVPRNDGTNNADYLLAGSTIKAIAVDGANRKWIGTESDGVFLVSPDGLTTIHSFNTSNSPLPSNEILSIAIDPAQGEVYFATALGIVSYSSGATMASSKIRDIKIYPNPIKPNYVGMVKIVGLEENTSVVITDINGRSVYQTMSLGGMAQWDCCDVDRKQVASGTYIVWVANEDGSNSAAGKILVVR